MVPCRGQQGAARSCEGESSNMRCPNVACGAEIKEGSAFCERCGTPIPATAAKPSDAPVIFCEHCGARLSTGAAFCHRCGKSIGTVATVETTMPESAVEQRQVVPQVADMHATPLSTGETETQAEVPRPTDAQVTVPAATGKKPSGGKGLKVAVIVLAVAVVAMGIGLGGILTNWYGLGGGGTQGEVRAVSVEEFPTERTTFSYDDRGNIILDESTTTDGSPITTTNLSFDINGNPIHTTMLVSEEYKGLILDTDTVYDYEFDDQGRATVSYAKEAESDQIISKTYFSYYPDGTFKEIKSCYCYRTLISGSPAPDTYRYQEETQVFNEKGLPISRVVSAWPRRTESFDVAEYEADIRAGSAPEGGVLAEQHYEWSYDGWKPTSVTVRRCERRLEDGDNESDETAMTYGVDADEYGDVTTIRNNGGNTILQLTYMTIRSDTCGTAAHARGTMSRAIWYALEYA